MKTGRYRIYLGNYFWFQSKKPCVIRKFLCFSIVQEVDLKGSDAKQQFPPGTEIIYEGTRWRYMRAGKE